MDRTASRDLGLRTAIVAAGGVGCLARALGLSQPTVSVWTRVPPHHVISVEALTGISRRVLRPDLYDVPEPEYCARVPSASTHTNRLHWQASVAAQTTSSPRRTSR